MQQPLHERTEGEPLPRRMYFDPLMESDLHSRHALLPAPFLAHVYILTTSRACVNVSFVRHAQASDTALRSPPKPKKVRRPKQSPYAVCAARMAAALNALDAAVGQEVSTGGWAYSATETSWVWLCVCALRRADDAAALMDGIREACL